MVFASQGCILLDLSNGSVDFFVTIAEFTGSLLGLNLISYVPTYYLLILRVEHIVFT